jgi:hypothetical protein
LACSLANSDFVLAAVFIYAGAVKALDPVQFASDIDNYKILPWPVSVALAFYLPWLEILCALGLVFNFCIAARYRFGVPLSSSSPSPRKFADSTSPAAVSVTPANTGVFQTTSRRISRSLPVCLCFGSKA